VFVLSKSRRIGFVALAAALITSLAAAAATVPGAKSVWLAAPVHLDGRADDWTNVPRIANPKSGAEIAFQNDGRYLYILLVLTKPESAEVAEATGTTVLGHPEGSRKPARGALFLNGTISADGFVAWRESRGDVLTQEEKAAIRKTPEHTISLAFAANEKGGAYGPLTKQTDYFPPDFWTDQVAEGTIFEYRLPLAPPDLVPGGIGGTPGGTLRLTFKWGGRGRKSLSPHTGRESPTLRSGDLSGAGLTWAQEFVDTFDSMSRPTLGGKNYSFAVDVTLADKG
jgi:hypothetical protein